MQTANVYCKCANVITPLISMHDIHDKRLYQYLSLLESMVISSAIIMSCDGLLRPKHARSLQKCIWLYTQI